MEKLKDALKIILGLSQGDLAEAIRELDQSVAEVSDPKLRHYLERRSYAKAYDFIVSFDKHDS